MALTPKALFRAAGDFPTGIELWITDGTAVGTSLIKNINPNYAGSSAPGLFTQFGNAVLFGASGVGASAGFQLWITDGSAGGTSMVKSIESLATLSGITTIAAGLAVFSVPDNVHGQELWATDGTSVGTTLVKDINTAGSIYSASNPKYITAIGGGKAVFQADDGVNGTELWVTDGSTSGTSLVLDIRTGATGSAPRYITALGTKAIFQANDGVHGTELWVTDGTTAGTSALGDLRVGSSGSYPRFFAVAGSKAFFQATDGAAHGFELWVTDGTQGGTSLVSDVYPGGVSGSPNGLTAFGSGVLFFSKLSTPGYGAFFSDGTAGGTIRLSTVASADNNLRLFGFGVVNGRAIFNAYDNVGSGHHVWVTDGTVGGTSLLANVFIEAPAVGQSGFFTTVGGRVVFNGSTTPGSDDLWVTDGTTPGTSVLHAFATSSTSSPMNLASVQLACFASGTGIATPKGQIAVERLRAGDAVLTLAGTRLVRWIGHRHVSIVRHPRPDDVAPVSVFAHAFGVGAPANDLVLSPDHAVFADGVLVPIRYLLNGATIVQRHPDSVTYFHVELENEAGEAEHGILFAEGLTVESFLDTGNRSAFANGGAVVQAHPDFAALSLAIWERDACAKLATKGAELVALRSWLFARAEALGYALTAEAGLVLSIDGHVVAAHRDGRWLHLAVPAGSASLRLRSRNAVLAETLEDGADGRRLGVGLAGLVLDGLASGLDGPRLTTGWHVPEPGIRWNAGDAVIDVRGLGSLALALVPAARYWATPPSIERHGAVLLAG